MLPICKKLRDVCNIKNGEPMSADDYKGGDYPLIDIYHNLEGRVPEFNALRNAMIIDKYGMNMGCVFQHETKSFVTTDCCYLENFSSVINQKYLYQQLKKLQSKMSALGTDAGIINIMDISNLEIIVPPLEEQESFIDRLEAKQDEINELNEQYDEIASKIVIARREVTSIIDKEFKHAIVKKKQPVLRRMIPIRPFSQVAQILREPVNIISTSSAYGLD